MTLAELQAKLAERGVTSFNVDLLGIASVTVTRDAHPVLKVAQASADALDDAVEMALLRYDTWRSG